MAYTTINKSTDYFNTQTWTGTSDATTTVSGVGFQPDFTWVKNRNVADDHGLFDAVRGVQKVLFSNATNAESTNTESLTAFNSDGFVTGNHRGTGGDAGNGMVSWNWKANGAGSSNTDGSITSTVSANTTSGFSIVTFTGNSGTVGHGLGIKPDFIVIKSRQTAGSNNWVVAHSALGTNMNDNYIILNSTNGAGSGANTWGGEPTTTTFTVSSAVAANDNNVAYCFAGKTGYSKFGKYIGNGADGSTSNNFIYTGFKPTWVMVKRSNDASQQWTICDTTRSPSNVSGSMEWLFPDSNGVETDEDLPYMLSNGFMPRTGHVYMNRNGFEYIYMAFGQTLVGSNNTPCVAR